MPNRWVKIVSGVASYFRTGLSDVASTETGPMPVTSYNSAGVEGLTDLGAQADAAATTDTGTFSLIALVKRSLQRLTSLIALLPASLGAKTGAGSFSVVPATDTRSTVVIPAAAAAYRLAQATADVVAVPGTVTCTLLTAVGSATAGTYTIFVVAGNAYGRTTAKQGNTTVTTATTNLGVRAAFALVTGATYYDIYMSTDGAAAKFVGRVLEAQRLSGIIINGVNTTTAGGTANAVDIYVAGTGLAVNGGQLAFNSAYIPPALLASPVTDIACTGYQYCDFDLAFSRTGDIVAPAFLLIPFLKDSLDSAYYAGQPFAPTFDGAGQSGSPLQQSLRVEVRGRTAVGLCLAAIAGTGAAVDMRYTLS
jgi:hypothetical protein